MNSRSKIAPYLFAAVALCATSANAQAQNLGPTYIRHDARMHIREPRPQGYGPITAPPMSPMRTPVVGSYAGSYGGRGNDLSVWCDNTVAELERALQLGRRETYLQNYSAAQNLLMSGLQRASVNPNVRRNSLTARAIYRGIELTQIVARSMAGRSNAPRSIVLFLSEYYQFVINTANNLDRPFHIPHSYDSSYGMNDNRFEINFDQYVKDEVQMVLDVLTIDGGRGQIYPIGSTAAFINVLTRSLQYASADLQESPFVNQYACTLSSFQQLIGILQSGGIGNEPDTVNYAYEEASFLTDQIQTGCHRWR